MTYYHATKEAALEAGEAFLTHFAVRAELEPYNGWVIILQPRGLRSFELPLLDILEKAEIDMTGFQRLKERPLDYKRPPENAPAPARTRAPVAPKDDVQPTWKPGAALPWAK